MRFKLRGSNESFILIHVYVQSYLCLPPDAVLFSYLFSCIMCFKWHIGPGVKSTLTVVDSTLGNVYTCH